MSIDWLNWRGSLLWDGTEVYDWILLMELQLTRNKRHLTNVQPVNNLVISGQNQKMPTISEHKLQNWDLGPSKPGPMSWSPGFPHGKEEDYTIIYKDCRPTPRET